MIAHDVSVAAPDFGPPLLNYQQGDIAGAPPGWTNVRVYRYKPQGWRKITFRRWGWRVGLGLVFVSMVCAYWYVNFLRNDPRSAILATGGMVVLFIGINLLSLLRQIRRNKDLWPTYRLILADQGVFRACKGYPTLTIPFDQIKEIRQTQRGLAIVGQDWLQVIYVAAEFIDDYSEIRSQLVAVRPIRQMKQARILAYRFLAVFISAGFLGTYLWGAFSQSLVSEIISLSILVSVAVWSLTVNWRNPNVSQAQRIGTLASLMFPFLLILKIALVHGLIHLF